MNSPQSDRSLLERIEALESANRQLVARCNRWNRVGLSLAGGFGLAFSAMSANVVSAVPALGPYTEPIIIGVILLMCYGNLRGLKEAWRIFALPTYLFSGAVILMIVVGLVR